MSSTLRRHLARVPVWVALILSLAATAGAQDITQPIDFLGFNLGDDYQLSTYEQLHDYWSLLGEESPRMVTQSIGLTEEGRPQIMAIITSPDNHRNLSHYRSVARRLALAEGLDDAEARELAEEGKSVIWIDGGLHATEVLGAQQLTELVYQMVTRNDAETLRFLDDIILLAVHANPDGQELVSNWYMRKDEPEDRSTSRIPRLYQKYVGHDNNRDFYMSTQSESVNMNRVLYREWFPQIVYNHHQTGPAGTVMFAPPFRDPFNYNYHPLLPLGIEAVGTAMHTRFVAEGKPGTTMRSGASYSTWWNGGLRTTPYFHNQIGLLTETIGNPTPQEIPLILDRQLPKNDIPMPIAPQKWHFRQSIDYSQTANRAVLNYASRNKADLLYNIYVMGRDNIAKGNTDTWRTDPRVITAAGQAAREMNSTGRGIPTEIYETVFRDPELRDPRGYIIPRNQADFPTATKFANTLIKNGVMVQQASRGFSVQGKTYQAGSFVVMTGQAFRPFVLDMFEPQVHPNDFAYPGAAPTSPYDNTGWTVAYQMGVEFDRVLDGFEGPFDNLDDLVSPPRERIANARRADGYLLSHAENDSFIAMNRLLASGHEVFWLTEGLESQGTWWPAGTMYVPDRGGVRNALTDMARELGITIQGVPNKLELGALEMRRVRVGLWDRYGGSMASGWARWILEQYEFDFELVFPKRLDRGDLSADFDVLVFVNGGIPSGTGRGRGFGGPRSEDSESIPEEWQDRLGSVTIQETIPQIESFLKEGGTVIAIGGSTGLANHLDLGLDDYLVDYEGKPLGRDDYFVPGSVVRIQLDNSQPVAWGMPAEVDVHFNNSPVFTLPEDESITPLAWFNDREPLRSGWAWGQHYLNGGVTMAQATVGEGQLYLFGPEIIRRAQPHGTFKLLFNGIALSGATEPADPPGTND